MYDSRRSAIERRQESASIEREDDEVLQSQIKGAMLQPRRCSLRKEPHGSFADVDSSRYERDEQQLVGIRSDRRSPVEAS